MIRGERGAGGALLSLVLSSCLSAAEPSTSQTPAPAVAPAFIANQVARLLLRVSAYDYALAGSLAGERVHVVTPDRYAVALATEPYAIATLKDEVVKAAFADPALSAPLVQVADASATLAGELQRFIDERDDVSFARILPEVTGAWSALRRLAATLPADAALASAIARGTAWTVGAERSGAYAVLTAPFASSDEAQQAARRIGAVEHVAAEAPFTVRVLTTPERGAAEKRVEELRAAGIVAAVVDVDSFNFVRSGPAPMPELWREPLLDLPTPGGAKRANFVTGGIVVAASDGVTTAYDETGRSRWAAKVSAGPSFVTPSADGALVLVGGQFAQVILRGGETRGERARLPSAAAGAVWLERRAIFVAASQGPTGKPEGGGGGVVAMYRDGTRLPAPFPLVTPAAGPALATSLAGEEVYIATTSQGTTDVEVIRPGLDTKVRPLVRAAGQVTALAVDAAASYALLVTAQGSFRFRPAAPDPQATLERVADPARDTVFGGDGTLYLLFPSRLVAYDPGLQQRWSTPVADGRRVLVGKRVIVQDGLQRVLAVDSQSGATDELARLGDINDLAVSRDGARVLLLVDGARAVVFQLP